MGNRAVITCSKSEDVANSKDIGIYLHWSGGRDSIEAFLTYCKLRGFRSPKEDEAYGMAYLCSVICNYFGDGLSCGIGQCQNLDCDNWDNGVYVIDGWNIVDRKYIPSSFKEQSKYDLKEMLIDINNHQPEQCRLEESLIINYIEGKGAFYD